ncbi:hypothetical protein ANN_25355 [Periplaneta americana]|uniref:Uncharacterized protein n=1 Tax=Periplaneta americana TaxID=6978 RepID=A0ABQ8S142_PERAM|nr:hypothetical protein ANN_25355 [Periplaneta americana]
MILLSFSPTTPGWSHIRLLGLLAGILVLSGFMFLICVAVGFFGGLNTFAFMVAEVLYTVECADPPRNPAVRAAPLRHAPRWRQWGTRVGEAGSCGLLHGAGVRVGSPAHRPGAPPAHAAVEQHIPVHGVPSHLHAAQVPVPRDPAAHQEAPQLPLGAQPHGAEVSQALGPALRREDAIFCYPMASAEELAENSDNCAICWEKMETARKLPCTHLFHNSCLQSWLEQDTSCPTCRMVLSIQSPAGMEAASRLEHNLLAGENQGDNQTTNRRPPNHFFHFDGNVVLISGIMVLTTEEKVFIVEHYFRSYEVGHQNGPSLCHVKEQDATCAFITDPILGVLLVSGSRYVSWLPSFSVEVTHTQLLRSDQPQPAQTSQLDAMARQVQQLFPHLALTTVIEDLRATRSVELTIENVLDGRVVAPPPMFQRDTEPPPPELEYSPGPVDMPSQHWDELSEGHDPESIEATVNLGGRFSKSSTERERILQLRKEQLLLSARRRYMERHKSEAAQGDGSERDAQVRHRHADS